MKRKSVPSKSCFKWRGSLGWYVCVSNQWEFGQFLLGFIFRSPRSGRGVFNMYNGSVYCRQIPLGLGGVCSICTMGLCTVDRSLLVWAGCVQYVQWVCVLSTDPSWSGRGVFNMYNGSVYCRQIPLGLGGVCSMCTMGLCTVDRSLGLGGVCSICIMGLCTVDRSLSVWAGCVQYV